MRESGAVLVLCDLAEEGFTSGHASHVGPVKLGGCGPLCRSEEGREVARCDYHNKEADEETSAAAEEPS